MRSGACAKAVKSTALARDGGCSVDKDGKVWSLGEGDGFWNGAEDDVIRGVGEKEKIFGTCAEAVSFGARVETVRSGRRKVGVNDAGFFMGDGSVGGRVARRRSK